MTKTTTCVTILVIAAFAALKLSDWQEDAPDDLPAVLAQDQKIQEVSVNYYTFKGSFDATLAALRDGEINLADACDRVAQLASAHNPNYILHLTYVEKGASSRERIARNLVGHVQSLEERGHEIQVRLKVLEVELSVLLEELHEQDS